MCICELGASGHLLICVRLLVDTCVSSCVYVLACLCGFNLILCPCRCGCMSRFVCCVSGSMLASLCRHIPMSLIVCLSAPRVSVSACVYFCVQVSLSPKVRCCGSSCVCVSWSNRVPLPCCLSPVLCPLPQGEPLPGHFPSFPELLSQPASPEHGPEMGKSRLPAFPCATPPARPEAGYKFPCSQPLQCLPPVVVTWSVLPPVEGLLTPPDHGRG